MGLVGGASILFKILVVKDFFIWVYCGPADANPHEKANEERLKTSRHCTSGGGFNSATVYNYGKHSCYIKKRVVFIKDALEFGL